MAMKIMVEGKILRLYPLKEHRRIYKVDTKGTKIEAWQCFLRALRGLSQTFLCCSH